MKLARIVNRILGRFGVSVVRTGTPAIASPVAGEMPAPPAAPAQAGMDAPAGLGFETLLRHQIAVKWDIIDRLEQDRPAPAQLECPLCGCQAPLGAFRVCVSRCIFEGGELVRHQCPACDLIFGPDKMLRLSGAALAAEYEWHYRVFSEGDSTAQELRAFHALQPVREGVYLNWGAGAWSTTVGMLRQQGWNVFGYEPHGTASAGGPHTLTSRAQLDHMRFDGIFSNNVIEHLRHPVSELEAMRGLLAPGGRMSHATPCYEYRFEFTRFHLFFYLGRSRALLAGKAGLHVESYEADGDFMNLVLSQAGGEGGVIA